MTLPILARTATAAGLALLVLSACGNFSGMGSGTGSAEDETPGGGVPATREAALTGTPIWSLFGNQDDPNTTVEVNKYLWQASLEILNFLPIETVDPFTGVIVTGFGAPPGGGRAYRATIHVSDPALDARGLRLSLQQRGGGSVSPETQRAVEDAILTRARQLRIRDIGL